MSAMTPALSMCHREVLRFLRQRHRIIGALATPIVFWLLIGGGMGRSFQSSSPGGGNYLHYFFPGTVLMILLFTAIFSTISVIEDRKEGFLAGRAGRAGGAVADRAGENPGRDDPGGRTGDSSC
jgi:ABC-type multidrug transport system permease subunit